jgi:hypothetical protein
MISMQHVFSCVSDIDPLFMVSPTNEVQQKGYKTDIMTLYGERIGFLSYLGGQRTVLHDPKG